MGILYHTENKFDMYHDYIKSTRTPNFVVLRLYSIAYWFGDFGPMIASIKQYMAEALGALLNYLILFSVIAVSVTHTIEMYQIAGAKLYQSWLLTFVTEAGFIYSSILLQQDFKDGNKKSGVFTWAAFGAGLVILLISNIMGMKQEPLGWFFGSMTPFWILVVKGLLSHQAKRNRERKHQLNPPVENESHELKKKLVDMEAQLQETSQKLAELTSQNSLVVSVENYGSNQPIIQVDQLVEPVENTLAQIKSEASEIKESSDMVPSEKTVENSKRIDEILTEKDAGEIDSNIADNSNEGMEEIPEETTEKKLVTIQSDTRKLTSAKLTRKAGPINKKSKKKTSKKPAIDPFEYLWENHLQGRKIGRPTLMKETGCNDSQAKKAIEKLNEELEKIQPDDGQSEDQEEIA